MSIDNKIPLKNQLSIFPSEDGPCCTEYVDGSTIAGPPDGGGCGAQLRGPRPGGGPGQRREGGRYSGRSAQQQHSRCP